MTAVAAVVVRPTEPADAGSGRAGPDPTGRGRTKIADALAAVFAPSVQVAVVAIGAVGVDDVDEADDMYGADVRAAERALVAGSSARRRGDFFAGRAAAHAVLRRLGRDDGPIGVGAHRAPCWPTGVVGAIAHAGGWAVAVAAVGSQVRGLGVDIEELEPPLEPRVARLVTGPADSLGTDDTGAGPLTPYAAKIAFCIKEAVYKCLFPMTGCLLEYGDVAVELDLAQHRYRAVLAPRWRLAGAPLPPLSGCFAVIAGYILAGAVSSGDPTEGTVGHGRR